MSELHVRKDAPIPSTLIPMPGVDFNKPWLDIVQDVNTNLTSQRYKPFQIEVPLSCIFSDHNASKPTLDEFDPVRVEYDILNEGYDPRERAVAKLGLQSAYWNGLAKVMSPRNHTLFPYEDWQKYSTVPIVRLSDDYFLMGGARSIQYGGDGDMIGYVTGGSLTIDGIDVPFGELGIDDSLLNEYLDYRKKIDKSETLADKTAILDLREDKPELWARLKAVYPRIDTVIEGTAQFSFSYLKQARELTTDLVQDTADSPQEVKLLTVRLTNALSDFLQAHTRVYYGISLLHNPEFYSSIQGLGNVLDIMYLAAKDFW